MPPTICTFVGSRFRVMAKTQSRKQCLIRLFPTPRGARMWIEQFKVTNHRQDDQLRALWIEEWVGKPTHGYWRRMLLRDGGFYFKVVSQERSFQINSGGIVDAILLPERTRRGGWNAALEAKPGIMGPVTKIGAWPTDWKPGQKVKLKLCSLSKSSSRAQFAMPS